MKGGTAEGIGNVHLSAEGQRAANVERYKEAFVLVVPRFALHSTCGSAVGVLRSPIPYGPGGD